MSNEHIIDVEFEEDKFYTLGDVSAITKLSEAKIAFFCNKLNEFLKIQSIGMYQIFSSSDIDNLVRIKELEDKGMNLSEIKEYLRSNKQEILIEKEENKINISALEVFSKIFEMQNKKIDEVFSLCKQVLEVVNKNSVDSSNLLSEKSESIQEKIETAIAESLDEKFNGFDNILKTEITNLGNELQKEIKETLNIKYVSRDEFDKKKKKNGFFSRFINS